MALIDVSDLLNDPDFVNEFTVVRRTSTVNDFGENIIGDTNICAIGSIQAGNGDTLRRLPEAARKENAITVYTKTELKADNNSNGYSDIIVWKNQRFQVLVISPWGNYGAGWYQCDCIMEKASI
jgi:hypothetical protein